MAMGTGTRYLITGGAGFIGSHLAEALVARGDSVTVLDDLSTGDLRNLDDVVDRVTIVPGSVTDALVVDQLVSEIDVVVHLAASVGVKLIVERPLHSLLTNVVGSETILEAAHRYRRKILLASSSEIYGKELSRKPFKEDDDRVLGSNKVSRWAYSTSKAVDEMLAFAYHREKGIPTVVARLFNTVGPRQTSAYGMVVPRFVEQALEGTDLTVYGDGTQSRCFCHVLDVVDGLLLLVEDERGEGDVFNMGSTEEISVLDLAHRVIKLSGSSSGIRFVRYEDAYEQGFEDMQRRVPSIDKISQLTGWAPKRTLDEIIIEVIQDQQRKLNPATTRSGP